MYGIFSMLCAIKILSQDHMSVFHTQFAKLCLKANCFAHALPVINKSYVDLLNGITPIDIATFNYYSGMLFLGLREYS